MPASVAGDGAVDAFMGEQQRALDAVCLAERKQRIPQSFEAREGNKMIEARQRGTRRLPHVVGWIRCPSCRGNTILRAGKQSAIYIWHQGVRHPTRAGLRKDHAEVFHILRYMRKFARE